MSNNYLAGQSSVWVLPEGPNTEPKYLACHSVGDIANPKGDETLLYCPDPSTSGKFIVKNSFTGEPGTVTASIETEIAKTADYLEELGNCRVPIYIHKVNCGRRDVFTNFGRSFILRQSRITNESLSALAAATPGDEGESKQSFDISARNLIRIFKLQPLRSSVVSPGDLTGISICGEDRCEDNCGSSQMKKDYLFVTQKLLAGSSTATAEVMASINQSVWAPTAADPFADDMDIQGIVCFKIGTDTLRILVAKGTTDGGPMEIAFTDNYGVSWTTVHVGSTNGEYTANSHALFALDRYHIWVGTDSGRIYYSSDAGLTWTLQENASISATDIVGISFVDGLIGFALYTGGEIAKTTDGGTTWSAATPSGATTGTDIHAISPYFVWATGAAGAFYTHDGGVTWGQRLTFPIGAIDFMDELVGIVVGSASSADIYQTIDGGFDWDPLPALTNAGYLDVKMVDPRLAYVTGKVSGGLGLLATLTPVP